MKKEWFKIDNTDWGLSKAIVLFDKVRFYAGTTDHWGIGIYYCHYDTSLTIDILCWYIGVEAYHELL
jgi:hypothetical protein